MTYTAALTTRSDPTDRPDRTARAATGVRGVSEVKGKEIYHTYTSAA